MVQGCFSNYPCVRIGTRRRCVSCPSMGRPGVQGDLPYPSCLRTPCTHTCSAVYRVIQNFYALPGWNVNIQGGLSSYPEYSLLLACKNRCVPAVFLAIRNSFQCLTLLLFTADVLELCNLSPVGLCEVEEVVMRSKVQCINVYYGGLVMLPQPST